MTANLRGMGMVGVVSMMMIMHKAMKFIDTLFRQSLIVFDPA